MHDSERQHEINQLLVESSLGLMCIHDLDGVILAVNPAVAESLGYTVEEGPGHNLREFLAADARPLFDGYLRRLQRSGSDTGVMRLVAKDGTERFWMYRNTAHTQEGSRTLILGHALDITERIRAEQALKEAKTALREANEQLSLRVKDRTAELQRANEQLRAEIEQRKRMEEELLQARKLESLGVLAGGIAHDFNNFLTVVQGNIELARIQSYLGERVHDILDQTLTACNRAAQLASQLLIFARGGTPVRRVTSIGEMVQEAANLARAGSAISIEVDLAGELHPAEVDPGQIGQVLHNILLNAKQAMPQGGMIEVRAENVVYGDEHAERAGEFVRISIRDYGAGIQPDALRRVFDPYFTTKTTGTGLGLATAYAIVGRHGGHLSVTSKPGAGTVFTIDLPASHKVPEPIAVPSTTPHPGSGKLLVMDDEDGLRRLLQRVLTSLGYEVECASDGAEAIVLHEAALQSGRPFEAILLDLTVNGGMGGMEAAAQLREVDRDVKVIVSSGYSDAAAMANYRTYGFDDVLRKPWTPSELGEVVERVLKTAERRLR